ncbi:DUF6456 domain-containing protein [Oceanomicrobium pacificus]|uniref:Helix-turn-helix domain-containing protein n=1 Tax=Oceanomicrobium pacificus TaxID=2692916 RepID=A0A6B0TNR8_9RHOB|nr:DUF6456 domain-containing protein [Oceanomicrobium pacificus]MXU66197.1 helix-turn-helix domain-containing protein [Oceanomicrobium pacificus]
MELATRMPPDWVPDATRIYLEHTGSGVSYRAIARREGCHPSTILRRVRRIEERRDDPLFDDALTWLHGRLLRDGRDQSEDPPSMTVSRRLPETPSDAAINREARRILRRLCESGAELVIARDLARAAVLKVTDGGAPVRIGTLDRDIAMSFALRDWIEGSGTGRVARYRITPAGRAALKRLIEEDRAARKGAGTAADPFRAQHRIAGTRTVAENEGGRPVTRTLDCNLAESPLAGLGRKRDRNGNPYLSAEQIEAGERLRDDFERAHMGPRMGQNWDRFLVAGATGGPSERAETGSQSARDRFTQAMVLLGPGLSDVVLRCCCYLEGLEVTEKRLGWSARSAKVVLCIALDRLAGFYGLDTGSRKIA